MKLGHICFSLVYDRKKTREKKEFVSQNVEILEGEGNFVFKFLKIEKRKRNKSFVLQIKGEKFSIFCRSRLLSMTANSEIVEIEFVCMFG